jgi:penicillin-binding protein 2
MSIFKYGNEVPEALRKKFKYYVVIIAVSFLVLWMRVWYLQILNVEGFIELSENNRIRKVSMAPYRGLMKDRNGQILVNIRPSFNLYITPEDVQDIPGTLNRLAEVIDFNPQAVLKKIKQERKFKNILIRSDIAREQVAFVEENNLDFPGVHLKVEPLRNYMYQDLSSHALGYLGEISKLRLENEPDDSEYEMGDLVGKYGLEFVFEEFLRGKKGFQQVEVDVSGRELRVLKRLPPKAGNNLVLTIDLTIQKELEEMMRGTPENPVAGSVVVMKVKTGEILALASKPSFDPNLFSAGISRDNWKQLLQEDMHPLTNRIIDGQYPPGSTYKIVTAYAALEEKVIAPDQTIFCPGYFNFGRGVYHCWKKGGHGRVNIHQALVQSCDVFFYTVGSRVGIDNLARYAKMFGLGMPSRIPLSGEKSGLIPTTKWKLLARKQPWMLGETVSAAIGQGFNLVTPIQQARMISVVANGGNLYRPMLVKRIESPENEVVREFQPELLAANGFNPQNLEIIRKALLGVVNEAGGTGGRARLKDVLVSGKTGTSQVVRLKSGDDAPKEKDLPYKLRDHAWFVAFAPFEDAEVAVSIIVEHGGHGGSTAAPLAKKLIEVYHKLYPAGSVPGEKGAA